jgi:hypothetical protein
MIKWMNGYHRVAKMNKQMAATAHKTKQHNSTGLCWFSLKWKEGALRQ